MPLVRLPPFPAWALGFPPKRRVGLLGGSFNPAHAGHRHIAELALKHLGLDEVWFMVSPGNPLKQAKGMAPLCERLASAAAQARHPRLRAVSIERELGTRFTADTLAALVRRFPRTSFVWLMGADNLIQLPRWERWSSIFNAVPIAVFARPSYSTSALAGKAAQRFSPARRRSLRQATRLASRKPPAWVFLHTRLHPASATSIRAMTRPAPKQRAAPGKR
ncbi:MAG TPA: nicotinate-nucleotide adenylyltransferase [Alphaproteobacteria bacterium]|nr:nicotinate-nucleotide adenylyltransferase [Alphaproteobacteria bacterium]